MVKSKRPAALSPGFASLVRPSLGIKNSVPALLTATQDVIAIVNGMDDCSPLKKNDPVSGLKDSQLSMTLTALRHDHPMVVSLESAVASAADQIMLCDQRKFPGGSLTFDSFSTSPPDHFRTDFEAKHSCLPYGFYYDTEDMMAFEDSILSKSPGLDLEDWIMDDLSPASCGGDDCYYLGETKHFKQTKDSGPTLAQLNLADTFDVDELLNSSLTFTTAAFNRSRLPLLPQEQPRLPVQSEAATGPVTIAGGAAGGAGHHHPVLQAKTFLPNVTPAKNLHPFDQQQKQQQNVHDQQALLKNIKCEPVEHSHSIPPACETPATKPVKSAASERDPGSRVISKSHPVSTRATHVTDSTLTKIVVTPKSVCTKQEVDVEKSPQPSPSKSSEPPRPRNSSMCTEGSVSSHDEGFASQVEEDSDDEDDEVEDSDDESFYGDYEAKDLLGASTSDDVNNRWALNMGRSRKSGQQRFFWQYNVQSKGPKGTRIPSVAASAETADPHVLAEAKDPVFSPECRVEGVKHAGKARRGDGNDLTPNPKKLLMIGLELKKLSKIINDLTPVAEVPVNARNKTRKEKNKLASRACRLKKKAQHEANKIKLFGLQQEHRKTMLILRDIRELVRRNFENRHHSSKPQFTSCVDQAVAQHGEFTLVAGRTSDFVNSILDNVSAGQTDGGLRAF